MRRTVLAAFITTIALLQGCVNAPPASDPFVPVSTPRSFQLKEPLVVIQKALPLATRPAEIRLEPGIYVAELENSSGTLFRGPKHCLLYEVQAGYHVATGGLYVPKDPMHRSRMYYYAQTDAVFFANRDAALARRGGSPVPGTMAGSSSGVAITDTNPGGPTLGSAMGTAIGGAIVSAVVESYIKDSRGKPAFLWEVDDTVAITAIRHSLQ